MDFQLKLKTPDIYQRPATGQDWLLFVLFVVAGIGLFGIVSAAISPYAINEDGGITTWAVPAIGGANFVTLAGTFLALGIAWGHISWSDVGLRPVKWQWLWLVIGSAVAILIIPLRGLLALAAQLAIEGNLDSVTARGDLFTSGGFSLSAFLFALLFLGILAPISEELFFRGLLHTWGMKFVEKFWVRALITSTLFGLAHLDSIGVTLSALSLIHI